MEPPDISTPLIYKDSGIGDFSRSGSTPILFFLTMYRALGISPHKSAFATPIVIWP
jgi:hypothetical protein